MLRMVLIVVLATAGMSSVGCVQIYDMIDYRIIECRSKGVAKKAWHNHADYWAEEVQIDDFEDGFRAGYLAVMEGKGTRPPTLPPRKYWSARNMKADCQERTRAWFNGYHSGAAVALGDGVESLCRITTSEQLLRRPKSDSSVDWSHPLVEKPSQSQERDLKEYAPEPMLVPPATSEPLPVPPIDSEPMSLPPTKSKAIQTPNSQSPPPMPVPPAPVKPPQPELPGEVQRIEHLEVQPIEKIRPLRTLDLYELDHQIKRVSFQRTVLE